MDALDAALKSFEAVLKFHFHAACGDAFFDEIRNFSGGNNVGGFAVDLHTVDIRQEHQLVCLQADGELRRDSIGINIENLTFRRDANARTGNEIRSAEQARDGAALDIFDVADKTVI